MSASAAAAWLPAPVQREEHRYQRHVSIPLRRLADEALVYAVRAELSPRRVGLDDGNGAAVLLRLLLLLPVLGGFDRLDFGSIRHLERATPSTGGQRLAALDRTGDEHFGFLRQIGRYLRGEVDQLLVERAALDIGRTVPSHRELEIAAR